MRYDTDVMWRMTRMCRAAYDTDVRVTHDTDVSVVYDTGVMCMTRCHILGYSIAVVWTSGGRGVFCAKPTNEDRALPERDHVRRGWDYFDLAADISWLYRDILKRELFINSLSGKPDKTAY